MNYKFVAQGWVNGKRKRAYFKTKTEADEYASEKNSEVINHGMESLSMSSQLRVMALDCSRKLSPFGKTIQDAVNFYLPHLESESKGITVADLRSEIIKSKSQDKVSDRYLKDLRLRLKKFGKEFDTRNVASVTMTEADSWLRSLNLGGVSRNNYRRVLVVAFNYAKDRGYSIHNPFEKVAQAKDSGGEIGILKVDDLKSLLEKCDNKLIPFVSIGAFAGLRTAELWRLDWRDINIKAKLIEVKAKNAKSARRRFISIRPNLIKWLKLCKNRKGGIICANHQALFEEARKKAGIAEWPHNALRHSFASYDLAYRNDSASLALELGHTNSRLIFEHYRQLVTPKEAKAYWRIYP